MKKALVFGAGGFIGAQLVIKLKAEGYWVKGVDIKLPSSGKSEADDFVLGDLRDGLFVEQVLDKDVDELYQLAADMGGAGYIFSGENDADVMHNSAIMNLHTVNFAVKKRVQKVFFSSSACVYPRHNQLDTQNPNCRENSVYPANPDSEYGWEKLFSERLFLAFSRNHGLNVKIARLHNVYGPGNTWEGGREKAPAAICRKVIAAVDGTEVEIWGDGSQTRSFLYVEDCLAGIRSLMESDFSGPVNLGSEELISIRDFTRLVISLSGKKLGIQGIKGAIGVKGRNSHNELAKTHLNWEPQTPLAEGIRLTYNWIAQQMATNA